MFTYHFIFSSPVHGHLEGEVQEVGERDGSPAEKQKQHEDSPQGPVVRVVGLVEQREHRQARNRGHE
eukprot:378476-Pyramimonas_sp.AAC.1